MQKNAGMNTFHFHMNGKIYVYIFSELRHVTYSHHCFSALLTYELYFQTSVADGETIIISTRYDYHCMYPNILIDQFTCLT